MPSLEHTRISPAEGLVMFYYRGHGTAFLKSVFLLNFINTFMLFWLKEVENDVWLMPIEGHRGLRVEASFAWFVSSILGNTLGEFTGENCRKRAIKNRVQYIHGR
jgi:hypothetical protein